MTSSSTHLTIVGSVLTIALVFALIPQIAFAVMLPIKLGNTSVIFIDFRDENGSPNEESAGKSTGLLYRWLSDSNTVEGLYGYVDQNKSPNNNRLKRFVLGFESLSNHWSYRINGYIPTKDMKRIEGSGKLYIKGHNVYEEQSGYYERARPGLELSASYTIPYLNNTKAHIKGYTFWSRHASSVTGGSIRVEKQINDHVNLVTSLQHDSIEGWDNYAGIKFNYKFGGVKKMPSDHNIFKKMAVPIQKLDEVPSYRVYKLNYEGKPDKEQPLDFFGKRHDKLIFVDNEAQSVGDGTRENPYNNLEDAEKNSKNRELIYVLYGDGTSNGYGSGFTMKEGQSLVGSGVGLSLRGKTLIAPKMSSKGKPIMTKITNKRGAIVKLANKSSVAGFEFNVRYIGIYGWDIDRVSIFNNMFYSELPNTSDTAIKLANEGNITDTTANIYYNRFHSLGTGIQVLSSGKPESTILKDSLINLNIFQNIFGYTTFPINLRFNAIAKHWLILKANRFSHNIEGLSIYSNKASVGSRIIGNIFNRTYRCAICFKMGSYEEDSRFTAFIQMNKFNNNIKDIEVSGNNFYPTVIDMGGGPEMSIGVNAFSHKESIFFEPKVGATYFTDNNYWAGIDLARGNNKLPYLTESWLPTEPDFLGCLDDVIDRVYDSCPVPKRLTDSVEKYSEVDTGTKAAVDYLKDNDYEWASPDCPENEDCSIKPDEFFSERLAADPAFLEKTILSGADRIIHKQSIILNANMKNSLRRVNKEFRGLDGTNKDGTNKDETNNIDKLKQESAQHWKRIHVPPMTGNRWFVDSPPQSVANSV